MWIYQVFYLFARTLTNGGTKHVWRWTGFNHGLDLVIEYSNLNLALKRNIPGWWIKLRTFYGQQHGMENVLNEFSHILVTGQYNEHNALIATHPTRRLMYRVSVASLNDQKQVCTGSSSHLRTMLPHSSSWPLPAFRPNHAT